MKFLIRKGIEVNETTGELSESKLAEDLQQFSVKISQTDEEINEIMDNLNNMGIFN